MESTSKQALSTRLESGEIYRKVQGGVIVRVSDGILKALQDTPKDKPLIKYTEISNIWSNLKGNGEVQFIPTIEEHGSTFLNSFTQMTSDTVVSIIRAREFFQGSDENRGFDRIVFDAHKQLDAVERQAKGEIALASMGPALALFNMRLKDEEETGKQLMTEMRNMIQSGKIPTNKHDQYRNNRIERIIDKKILPLTEDIMIQILEGYDLYPSIKWKEIYEKITPITNSFLNNILDEELNLIKWLDFSDFISKYSQRSFNATQETL